MFDPEERGFKEILGLLERYVVNLEPDRYAPADVPTVLKQITRAEKLCGTARLLMARRAAALRTDEADGRTSAAKWLAEQSGDSVSKARRDLETADGLKRQTALEDALRSGRVSPAQASVLMPTIEADPDAASSLIEDAQHESFNELRSQCLSVIAAKRTEEEAIAREARLRAQRYLHIGTTEDGAISIRGQLTPVDGAVVKNTLESLKGKIFDEARRQGRRESHDAYMADALVAICQGNGITEVGRQPRAEIVLHVDAEALRRGELQPAPEPSSSCTRMSTSHPSPISGAGYPPIWRRRCPSETVCAPSQAVGLPTGSSVTTSSRPTELANLVKRCKRHHFLKTHKYWRLVGQPGAWRWINIRPDQEVVAATDDRDVAPPGEPVAGLARPVLRPLTPLGDAPGTGDGRNAREAEREGTSPAFLQQTFACRESPHPAGTSVTIRISLPAPSRDRAAVREPLRSRRRPAVSTPGRSTRRDGGPRRRCASRLRGP